MQRFQLGSVFAVAMALVLGMLLGLADRGGVPNASSRGVVATAWAQEASAEADAEAEETAETDAAEETADAETADAETAETEEAAETAEAEEAAPVPSRPLAVNLLDHRDKAPLAPGKAVQGPSMLHGELVSLHSVQLRTTVPPHIHALHDETVCVIQGRARMLLGDREFEVRAGSVIYIPRGTVHAVTNLDTTDVVVALSSFAPPFDGKDRQPAPDVDW